MSFVLINALKAFVNYLEYNNLYKLIYLLIIVSFVAGIYLISCYFTGVLKNKNFRFK
tara:strand:- start:138 stop:308 length:171 start_codon:yes stop_codon:yes gene_type:complete